MRRFVVDHTLRFISEGGDSRLRTEIEKWSVVDHDLDEFKVISTSLEAVFLREIIKTSNLAIDEIIVTDAFGFVRIASHSPELLLLFRPGMVAAGFKASARADLPILVSSVQAGNIHDAAPI